MCAAMGHIDRLSFYTLACEADCKMLYGCDGHVKITKTSPILLPLSLSFSRCRRHKSLLSRAYRKLSPPDGKIWRRAKANDIRRAFQTSLSLSVSFALFIPSGRLAYREKIFSARKKTIVSSAAAPGHVQRFRGLSVYRCVDLNADAGYFSTR